jgi:hypothetical protein
MATATPFDFNQPGYPGDTTAGFEGAPRRRPGGLTAVCIIAIVLGGLGILGALQAFGSVALQGVMQKTFSMPPQPGMTKDFAKVQKAQEEMQTALQDVGHKYLGFTLGAAALNMAISACLLIGGIMLLKMNPKMRTFMIAVFAVAIVYAIANAVVMVRLQTDMGDAMAKTMPKMMVAAGPKNAPGAQEGAAFVASFARAWIYVVIGFGLLWALFNVVFYAVGARYLCRPTIRQLFERPPAADLM